MKRMILLPTCVLSLCPSWAVLAQAPPPLDRAPGLPGQPEAGGFKPRELQDKTLEEKEQKKYDAQMIRLQKRIDATEGKSDSTLTAAVLFEQGTTQLQQGQEAAALASFEKAWNALGSAGANDARMAAKVLPQARKHLKLMSDSIGNDPPLVLAIMSKLASVHEQAYQAMATEATKRQYAGAMAEVWVRLMQQGELDDETMKKAAFWPLEVPELLTINRQLAPAERGQYEQELTFAQIQFEDFRRQLAQRAHRGGPRFVDRPGPNNVAQQLQQLQQQQQQQQEQGNSGGGPSPDQALTAVTDAKRAPLVKFAESQVHLRYGQFREAVKAATEGWDGLVQYYRQNPRGFAPDDTDLHFAGLDEAIQRSPVHALLLMDQLDKVYRAVLQVDPMLGLRLADTWTRLAARIPIENAGSGVLEKAVFWVDTAIKQQKELEQQYTSPLQDLQSKLDQAKQEEEAEKERAKAARTPPPRAPRPPADRAPRAPRGRTY